MKYAFVAAALMGLALATPTPGDDCTVDCGEGSTAYPPPSGNTYPPPGGNTYPPPSSGNAYPPPSSGNAYPPPSGNTYPPPSGGNAYPPPAGNPSPPPAGNPSPPPAGNPSPPPPAAGNNGTSVMPPIVTAGSHVLQPAMALAAVVAIAASALL
ncbi:hypothetical protein CDD81_2414 [Ophiocordyceps australis]|uniref:Uncharacterized protein n=1 Tax=Ophiocordyceps australis TaxID=1399860 RepID=A0A2C5XYT8_9HYPO|nr:hypothetical protein CDD81_2414 [Ophiocordyceps australis]